MLRRCGQTLTGASLALIPGYVCYCVEPGAVWTYNGGAVATIAKLIADCAGMPIDEYAMEVLFEPLGTTVYEWVHGLDDVPPAASGLRLMPF